MRADSEKRSALPPSVGSIAPKRPINPESIARSDTWSVEFHLLE